jgi:hypothetical protein
MHEMHRFRLLAPPDARTVALQHYRRFIMKFTQRFRFFDDILFLAALFVPLTLLLAGSIALAAVGSN